MMPVGEVQQAGWGGQGSWLQREDVEFLALHSHTGLAHVQWKQDDLERAKVHL